jgi:hypothetical protein
MMGVGFGKEFDRAMRVVSITIIVLSILAAISLWELAKWLFRHLSVTWN